MDKELLRKVQMTQLEIGLEVKRVCELLHINYFLDAGTLLGAVRHQGFIPCFFGAPSGTRTRDTLIKSQVLYQLS